MFFGGRHGAQIWAPDFEAQNFGRRLKIWAQLKILIPDKKLSPEGRFLLKNSVEILILFLFWFEIIHFTLCVQLRHNAFQKARRRRQFFWLIFGRRSEMKKNKTLFRRSRQTLRDHKLYWKKEL